MDFLHSTKKWTWPFLAFLAITPFTQWLDLSIAQFFYQHGNDPVEHFVSAPILDFLFDFGPLLANCTALASALFVLCSYIFPKLKPWRNPCLVLLLTYALGAGLLTNGILKEYWGRPRPKQVTQFGGTQDFRPYYIPNFFHQKQPSKSFPCGHCTMGFYFFALALVGKRLQRPWLWKLGLSLAFILGIAMSLARMSQGAHFFSDILFAALLMWYVALSMDWLVYTGENFP